MARLIDYMNRVPDEREVHGVLRECLSKAEATYGGFRPGWQYVQSNRPSALGSASMTTQKPPLIREVNHAYPIFVRGLESVPPLQIP